MGFQPSKCRHTHFQPQIWSIRPIFPNDSESLLKVCYIKRKNSEILSKLRNSEPVEVSGWCWRWCWWRTARVPQPIIDQATPFLLFCNRYRLFACSSASYSLLCNVICFTQLDDVNSRVVEKQTAVGFPSHLEEGGSSLQLTSVSQLIDFSPDLTKARPLTE